MFKSIDPENVGPVVAKTRMNPVKRKWKTKTTIMNQKRKKWQSALRPWCWWVCHAVPTRRLYKVSIWIKCTFLQQPNTRWYIFRNRVQNKIAIVFDSLYRYSLYIIRALSPESVCCIFLRVLGREKTQWKSPVKRS